jgi:hypothetical protein
VIAIDEDELKALAFVEQPRQRDVVELGEQRMPARVAGLGDNADARAA